MLFLQTLDIYEFEINKPGGSLKWQNLKEKPA